MNIWQVGMYMTEHSCKKERIEVLKKATNDILEIVKKSDLTPTELIGVLDVIAMSIHFLASEDFKEKIRDEIREEFELDEKDQEEKDELYSEDPAIG